MRFGPVWSGAALALGVAVAAVGASGANNAPPNLPSQGWTLGQQDWWSNIDQGSRLIPQP